LCVHEITNTSRWSIFRIAWTADLPETLPDNRELKSSIITPKFIFTGNHYLRYFTYEQRFYLKNMSIIKVQKMNNICAKILRYSSSTGEIPPIYILRSCVAKRIQEDSYRFCLPHVEFVVLPV